MAREYSLAFLTVATTTPPEAVKIAAELGYAAIGVRILAAAPGGPFQPLDTDAALLRETKAIIHDTGVPVFDIEIVRVDENFRADAYRSFMATGAELGARAILVAGNDPNRARCIDNFAALCREAQQFNLTCDLEFMPWLPVANARDALEVVTKAGEKNGRILVDALHFGRSHTTLADLASIPRELISYEQLCDATAGTDFTLEELIFAARSERALPGEGNIDLKGMLANLRNDVPLSLEVASDSNLATIGPKEWARKVLAASRKVAEGS